MDRDIEQIGQGVERILTQKILECEHRYRQRVQTLEREIQRLQGVIRDGGREEIERVLRVEYEERLRVAEERMAEKYRKEGERLRETLEREMRAAENAKRVTREDTASRGKGRKTPGSDYLSVLSRTHSAHRPRAPPSPPPVQAHRYLEEERSQLARDRAALSTNMQRLKTALDAVLPLSERMHTDSVPRGKDKPRAPPKIGNLSARSTHRSSKGQGPQSLKDLLHMAEKKIINNKLGKKQPLFEVKIPPGHSMQTLTEPSITNQERSFPYASLTERVQTSSPPQHYSPSPFHSLVNLTPKHPQSPRQPPPPPFPPVSFGTLPPSPGPTLLTTLASPHPPSPALTLLLHTLTDLLYQDSLSPDLAHLLSTLPCPSEQIARLVNAWRGIHLSVHKMIAFVQGLPPTSVQQSIAREINRCTYEYAQHTAAYSLLSTVHSIRSSIQSLQSSMPSMNTLSLYRDMARPLHDSLVGIDKGLREIDPTIEYRGIQANTLPSLHNTEYSLIYPK